MTTGTRRTALKGFLAGASAIGMSMSQASAQTAETTAPKPAGPVPKDWIDPKTGHRIIRISDEPGALGMYFYRHVYTPQGDIMVIKSPTGIQTVDLKTWKVTPLITGAGNDLLFAARKSRDIYYAVTDTGEALPADRPKTIFAINIDTKKKRQIARIPAGQISAMNADDTVLLGTVAYGAKPLQPKDKDSLEKFGQAEYAALGPDGKPLNFAKAKGVRMLERWASRVPAELFTIDIKTGARKVIYSTEEWIGHAQFSPTDPSLIRFCMEGPWHRVDRIKLINADGTNLRSVHTRTMNMEIWGHEFFSQDGKWLWFDLQTPRGQVFWVAGLELATGKRVWKRVEQNDWGVHFNVAHDGVTFASDGGDLDMVAHAPDGKWISLLKADTIVDADLPSYDDDLITIEKFTSTRLVDMSAHDYRLEPNLRFTPDDKWIVFCSNMHGDNHVYAVEVKPTRAPVKG
ncbi:oligogalacturonate lyase family protein [Asticcacaulis sp. ZE23SCel15]|uniref:oligogalacturonate lyase family protein n=1 Tax=Asticcacaulis sp. ZE23SCel15 TaxID=3059027 RepID=UPI00266041DF|nr:oligogalacturonate lyase family protein [Asticcacaulis sp. ZE23SCel15]WKL57317.1 oligogalacturonate lyase family protein [Asticcacaulis sp. ZE23SCel15]